MDSVRNTTSFLLKQVHSGAAGARDEFFEHVYADMQDAARAVLLKEQNDPLVQTTMLVHEACIRLLGSDFEQQSLTNRRHFFFALRRAMRQVLVDLARSRNAEKRGGGAKNLAIDVVLQNIAANQSFDFVLLADAIEVFEQTYQRQAEAISLRLFCGLSNDEIADLAGVSVKTVGNDIRFARSWLLKKLSDDT